MSEPSDDKRRDFLVGYGPRRGINWESVEEYLTGDERELREQLLADPQKFWHAQHPCFLLLERLSNVRRALAALDPRRTEP